MTSDNLQLTEVKAYQCPICDLVGTDFKSMSEHLQDRVGPRLPFGLVFKVNARGAPEGSYGFIASNPQKPDHSHEYNYFVIGNLEGGRDSSYDSGKWILYKFGFGLYSLLTQQEFLEMRSQVGETPVNVVIPASLVVKNNDLVRTTPELERLIDVQRRNIK